MCLLDSAPDGRCGSLVCFALLSAHLLAGFGFRLLVWFFGRFCGSVSTSAYRLRLPIANWFFGWFCLAFSTSACWIRLPIAGVVFWFVLLYCQYTCLLDSAPNCWCDSLVGFGLLSVHLVGGFGSLLLIWFFGWCCFIVSTSVCWIRLPIAGWFCYTGFISRLLM